MGVELVPVLYVAGIAVGTSMVQYVMDKIGHGDKNGIIGILGYCTAATYGITIWYSYLRKIGSVFGVFV